jgi:GNAT superfamily N-acetyltransferase
MNTHFLLLDATHILEIIQLIQDFTSNKFLDQILEQRFAEMFTQNYECVGVYDGVQLIGINGLWYQTRHYAGESCETDHVYIDPSCRSKGIGEQFPHL